MIRIVDAAVADVPVILDMIRGLAEYEKLLDECVATEEELRESLFGKQPGAEVVLAYWEEECVGFALFFSTYSTFLARRGLYLEDLFVKESWRGKGIGFALLHYLAEIAVARKCGRVEWGVLNWNLPSIEFYQRLGAVAMDEWTKYRLTGEALERLARATRIEN
jgi:GNAT superfamily N-acetyltransferase